jgi:hypothetical protein
MKAGPQNVNNFLRFEMFLCVFKSDPLQLHVFWLSWPLKSSQGDLITANLNTVTDNLTHKKTLTPEKQVSQPYYEFHSV